MIGQHHSVNRPLEQKLLLFGGTGSIGSAVRNYFQLNQWKVTVITRCDIRDDQQISWDPLGFDLEKNSLAVTELRARGPFDAVCWAQGANYSDNIYDFDIDKHLSLYHVNVLYILQTLHILVNQGLLNKPSRLCVISSIWQKRARQNKLSYSVTKAALEGLILSAAADLAEHGHVINAVLPGVIETPMTRTHLSEDQIRKVENSTLFDRLPTIDEVAACVHSLCQPWNTGVTGQFISVDLGFSNVRLI